MNKSPSPKFNLVLIGFRAVGKSTVGAQLAARLGRPFVDFDALLTQEAGESIPNLVARAGWPEFRRREKALVERYALPQGMVLATGGGVVLDAENVAHLQASGKLIWLKASPATIKARLSQDPQEAAQRPSLTAQGTLEEVDRVLAVREPLYEAAAAVSLAVDNLSAAEVTQHLVALVQVWEQENQ